MPMMDASRPKSTYNPCGPSRKRSGPFSFVKYDLRAPYLYKLAKLLGRLDQWTCTLGTVLLEQLWVEQAVEYDKAEGQGSAVLGLADWSRSSAFLIGAGWINQIREEYLKSIDKGDWEHGCNPS